MLQLYELTVFALLGPAGGALRYHAIVSLSFREKRLWASVAADRLSEGL